MYVYVCEPMCTIVYAIIVNVVYTQYMHAHRGFLHIKAELNMWWERVLLWVELVTTSKNSRLLPYTHILY